MKTSKARLKDNIISAVVMTIGTLIVALILLWATTAHAKTKHPPKPDLYDRAVNDCLDMTLLVGSEWRTAKRSFTWQQLQGEVAARLRVRRTEPWQR